MIALHQLPHKLQTTSLGHKFLHTPECALSSWDLLRKTPRGNKEDQEKGEGFRPDMLSVPPSEQPEPTWLHTTLPSPLRTVARAFEKSMVVVSGTRCVRLRISPVPPIPPAVNTSVTSEACSVFGPRRADIDDTTWIQALQPDECGRLCDCPDRTTSIQFPQPDESERLSV